MAYRTVCCWTTWLIHCFEKFELIGKQLIIKAFPSDSAQVRFACAISARRRSDAARVWGSPDRAQPIGLTADCLKIAERGGAVAKRLAGSRTDINALPLSY